jgi:EAL domain-containing protein (putative c-di-GMP-specific phosphodiesterase class I)
MGISPVEQTPLPPVPATGPEVVPRARRVSWAVKLTDPSEQGEEAGPGERRELERDLARALERHELAVHYQPIFDLRAGGIAGLEALVRWRHPSRGLVLPSEFIPLAEDTGQVLELGRWVLERACRQAARWRAENPARASLEIAVNLSGAQLRAPQLVDEVGEAMRSAELEPSSLLVEITETALVRDTAMSAAALDGLRKLGVRIAMDDFGTGYSSLHYLNSFPVDTMKLAKVFVDEVGAAGGREPAMARAIVALAEAFELRLIAEGIERADQVPALLELGCELGQGNHLSPALESEQAGALLSS